MEDKGKSVAVDVVRLLPSRRAAVVTKAQQWWRAGGKSVLVQGSDYLMMSVCDVRTHCVTMDTSISSLWVQVKPPDLLP